MASISLCYATSVTEKLPDELLAEIFLMLVSDRGIELAEDWLDTYWHRLQVMGVCRKWRDVVVSDPRLWTNILVQEVFEENRTPHIPFFKLCLSRSRNLPLSIYIVGDLKMEVWSSPHFIELAQILGAEASRCVSFSLCANYAGPYSDFQALHALLNLESYFQSAHRLRSVHFELLGSILRDRQRLYDLCTKFSKIPLLTNLTLDITGLLVNDDQDLFTSVPKEQPWSKWRSLTLNVDSMPSSNLVYLLQRCSHATRIGIYIEYLPLSSHIPLVQNTLRALHIETSTDFFGMVDSLTLPNLEVFQYELFFDEYSCLGLVDSTISNVAPFLQMISRSPRLQVLLVDLLTWTTEDLLTFVSHPTIIRIPTCQVLLEDLQYPSQASRVKGWMSQWKEKLRNSGPSPRTRVVDEPLVVGWVEKGITTKYFECLQGTLDECRITPHPLLVYASGLPP
ncbi:hypothetical protein P691DRAFT_577674 [Macrolepiota fuliginosa MF-IS2]|uniref:F-box domain-containing protein n=1 Tax=Macrolepiota fuliginosa MF-IS2 TaxID=1400762 RepID=A0A9P6C588_9AGAR|nr:hypothetical protein P691DRAFT_577674 [Macrolepiota fuliginosa MF-IS2]